jgi:very-short-patch-repair endonuclease/transcription elongation GreA/GreB family factor
LQSLGLDKFVLPLMGGYGGSDEFYEAVESRLNFKPSEQSRNLESLKQQFELNRDRLSSYIEVLTKPVLGTGMNVHQVLGLSISNATVINDLPVELRAVKIYPDKFIKGFAPADLDSLAGQIDEWCRRLSEAKILESSVWSDVPATNLDTDQINAALVNAREATLEIERSLAELDENSEALLKVYLDNPFENIQYELQEATQNQNLRKLHDIVVRLGDKETHENLANLTEINNELYGFKSQLSLSNDQLILLSQNVNKIYFLQELASTFDIQKIIPGIVAKTRQDVFDRSKILQNLVEIQNNLIRQLSIDIKPTQILAYSTLLDYQSDIKELQDFIRGAGILGARNEIRKAKSLYRSASQILAVSELPSLTVLRGLHETIQSGGLFSFLSSKIKKAKFDTVNLLSTVSESDSKVTLLSKLEEAIELSKEWMNLELSEHFKSLNQRVESRLTKLSVALDELQTTNEQSGLSEVSALKLINSEILSSSIEYLKKVDVKHLSWETIDEHNKVLFDQIQKIDSSLNELEEAEEFYLALGKELCNEFSSLIEVSHKANALLIKRSGLIETLGAEFEDDNYLAQIFACYKDYSSMSESSIRLILSEEGSQTLKMVSDQLEALSKIQISFGALLEAKQVDALPEQLGLNKVINILDEHRRDQTGLNSLIVRRSIFSEAKSLGLDQLVEKMELTYVKSMGFETAKASIVSSLNEQIQKAYGAALMQFDGISLNSARSKLQELDRRIIETSPQEVAVNAASHANPPIGNSYGRKSEYTEVSLLTHELQKKRRTPPRKILKKAQGALLELFPCWMMVPTAVAQHLPRTTLFDLVVIDEASQMTPENSISALMRGKNALIAGDTNQLPPTSFFRGLTADEDEDEDVTTTEESILELANMQFHPKHRLLWHYRSKHEDLIAFSNHYVYDNELVIFPSPTPTTRGLGISLIEVNGTFQRGINPAEAQVMLEAIAQFMEDNPERSLGVAVMNQSQMEQLETLVLREAETNNAVSNYLEHWACVKEGLEKFFVKNLENVQGDERDVIFIGTVYGRDPQGKFYQRFGPINGPAGKRRLNVLFSRAKEQVVTFSSIPLSEFMPSPTNEGATLLRRWLEFSATKRLGEVAHNHDRAGHTDSPFEDHVIEAVKSLGYEAVPQVGVSSYFIDIGVKHPSYPYGYICGIECDGATYHSSKNARDRDRLREEVLGRLGWSLYRVWSTDWFRDALGCRKLIKTYLEEKLSELIATIPEIVESKKFSSPGQIALEDKNLNISEVISQSNSEKNAKYIEFGSRFSIRYLDGPRAGVLVKFWLQRTADDLSSQLDGYKTLGLNSPLGEALNGGEADEIVSYAVSNKDIRVQIIEVET